LNAVHPEDRDRCSGIYVPAVEAHRPFVMEYRLRRADGNYRWVLDTGVPRYGADGRYAGYLGCSIDITARRNAEDAIREGQAALEVSHREVRHLAGRLIEAKDAERARIARDLHDDVSQQLAGMSIACSGLEQRFAESNVDEDLLDDLRALHQRTSALAQNVRHLSHDLHPTVLRHAGLVAALTAYCAELERTHGTVLTCRAEGDFTSIAPDVALCLYRIAQEALRNVIAHADARRGDVELLCTGDHAAMTITDDGKGFDVDSAFERPKGLGLVSITERLKLAGGTVSIVADAATGTRVRVQIPTSAGVRTEAGSAPSGASREYSFS
jgi:signal transduction histidine kinase